MTRVLAFGRTRRSSEKSSTISPTCSRKRQKESLHQLINDLQVLVLEDPKELPVVAALVARRLARLQLARGSVVVLSLLSLAS